MEGRYLNFVRQNFINPQFLDPLFKIGGIQKMTIDENKWFNSALAQGVSIGAVILAIGFGGSAAMKGCGSFIQSSPAQLKAKSEYQYKLQEADLNDNGIPDKFYTIDGKIALVELDGKPVSEFYKK